MTPPSLQEIKSMPQRLNINGEDRLSPTDPLTSLVDVLRDEFFLTGAKVVCREGFCGACTVLLDGRPVMSCLVPVGLADGCAVLTVEIAGAGRRPVAAAAGDGTTRRRAVRHVLSGHAHEPDELPGADIQPDARRHQGGAGRKYLAAARDTSASSMRRFPCRRPARLSEVKTCVGLVQCDHEFPATGCRRQAAGPHPLYRRPRTSGHASRHPAACRNAFRPDPAHRYFRGAEDAGRPRESQRAVMHRGFMASASRTIPLFATDLIRYDGEPLAAVAAETFAQAEAAAAAIVVEFEPLPAVISMAEALAPDAHLVHPAGGITRCCWTVARTPATWHGRRPSFAATTDAAFCARGC